MYSINVHRSAAIAGREEKEKRDTCCPKPNFYIFF